MRMCRDVSSVIAQQFLNASLALAILIAMKDAGTCFTRGQKVPDAGIERLESRVQRSALRCF